MPCLFTKRLEIGLCQWVRCMQFDEEGRKTLLDDMSFNQVNPTAARCLLTES